MVLHPPNLSYLPFQEDGINWMKDKSAVLLGDEMRLGKSIEACGWINAHPEIDTALIVCPATLCINWRRELDKWIVSPFVDSLVISYDMLHKLDFDLERDVVIFDEFHYCKNKGSKRSLFSRQIKAKNRLGLTGTPVLNRPVELWNLLHILDPVAWPPSSYQKYTIRYCNAHQGKWGWDVTGASHLDELKEVLKPIMIRRTKEMVLKDLPTKRRQIVELPASGIDTQLRFRLMDAKKEVEQIEARYAHDAQQLKCKVDLVWQEMAGLRHEAGVAKTPMIVDAVKDVLEEEEKLVLFAHHRDVIEGLIAGLSAYNPVHIHGGTPGPHRQQAMDLFQGSPKHRVFVGQIQAAGVGIALHAANHAIFAEIDWTPGVMDQAEARIESMGKKDSLLIQHMCLEGSLDALMAKVLVRKQSIIDRVF